MRKKFGQLRQLLGETAWAEYQAIRKNEKAYRWQAKNGDAVVRWRQRLKEKLVKYKGGKCEVCGYDKPVPAAFAFHHKDPEQKEFGIASNGNIRSFDRCTKEVDKCMLVCLRCHAEIHHEEYEISKNRTVHSFEKHVKDWAEKKIEFLRRHLKEKAEPFIKKIKNKRALRAC